VDLLAESLNKYEGTIILVSHDRYFISKTATVIWEIVDHKIKAFKGGYEEYVEWKERMAKSEVRNTKSDTVNSKPTEEIKTETTSNIQSPVPAIDREQKKELQRVQKQFSKLEEEINQLNINKTNLEVELARPENYSDKNKFLRLEKEYNIIQEKIASANSSYEQLFEKIMELEK
jgi:ATP-binding cassette subfamily F protein 3